jgi:hypothetical protein
MALCAGGNAPNITAFHFRDSVVLVSGQCGVPQWPGSTKLSRGVGQQRGHVPPPVAALGGNGTSPLYPVRCSVVSASGHGGVPPCPAITRLSRGVRGLCSVRPLRPPAALLHNAAFCKVQGSRCAKAPLGAPHRFAPFRVYKTGVMQSGLRWIRSHSRRRFPVVGTPYAPPSARPCGCRGGVASVRRCARCAWSVACGQSWCVCPRPPLCFAAARHQPCALVCPSAPRGGLPQPARLRCWLLLLVW